MEQEWTDKELELVTKIESDLEELHGRSKMIDIKTFEEMDNDDLHDNFCDWYKAVNNIKPRWVDPNDREYILSWIANELRPEVVQLRMEKVLEEQAWFAEMDALDAERRLQAEEAREEELEAYYYSLECYG